MSLTFTVIGTVNELTQTIFPPIELPHTNFGLGLTGFSTFNSIANVYPGRNELHYRNPNVLQLSDDIPIPDSFITVKTGAYEVTQLNKVIQQKIIAQEALNAVTEAERDQVFYLRPNINTQKCELYSQYIIDFAAPNSFSQLIGFAHTELSAFTLHESTLPVRIIETESLQVICNLVRGAYRNGVEGHTIFEFDIDVEPGYRISKEPNPPVYLPLTTRIIDNISITICNQNGDLVRFEDETVAVRLELKELS